MRLDNPAHVTEVRLTAVAKACVDSGQVHHVAVKSMTLCFTKNLPTALVACLAAVTLLSGCDFGTAPHATGVSLLITANFGNEELGSVNEHSVGGNETALSQLEAHFRVKTGPNGNRVVSIDGYRARKGFTWSLFIDGVAPTGLPGKSGLSAGEKVWWDLRPTAGAETVPAVVGSWPQPFITGSSGQEFPTLINCASQSTAACDHVQKVLEKLGVKASEQAFGAGSGDDSLSVVIAPFSVQRGIIAAELIQAGPASSGVYARFVNPRGSVLELLNGVGQVVQTLRGNVGLIAATQEQDLTAPVWVITGTDAAGVNLAAQAFNAKDLGNHYAVVVTAGGVTALPAP
jgi:hypothetical protein